jgi:hypothetical protein
MDYQNDDEDSPGSPLNQSLESSALSPKQYFLVNFSKFIVEIVGTACIGIFYFLMGYE